MRIRGSARLLWVIKKLNDMKNDDCFNFEAVCIRAGLDYYKVSSFLDMANGIMNNEIDFEPLLNQYQIGKSDLEMLAKSAPSNLI